MQEVYERLGELLDTHRLDEALSVIEERRTMLPEEDRQNAAHLDLFKARALLFIGELKPAEELLDAAGEVFAEEGDLLHETQAMLYKAQAMYFSYQLDSANAIAHKCLKIAEERGWHDNIGRAWGLLGWMAIKSKDYQEAERCLERSVEALSRTNRLSAFYNARNNLSVAKTFLGKLDEAEQSFREVLLHFRENAYKRGEAQQLCRLANVAIFRDDLRQAHELLLEAQEISIAHELPSERLSILLMLADVEFNLGEYRSARKNSLVALRLQEETGDLNNVLKTYLILAELHLFLNEPQESMHYANLGINFARQQLDASVEELLWFYPIALLATGDVTGACAAWDSKPAREADAESRRFENDLLRCLGHLVKQNFYNSSDNVAELQALASGWQKELSVQAASGGQG